MSVGKDRLLSVIYNLQVVAQRPQNVQSPSRIREPRMVSVLIIPGAFDTFSQLFPAQFLLLLVPYSHLGNVLRMNKIMYMKSSRNYDILQILLVIV